VRVRWPCPFEATASVAVAGCPGGTGPLFPLLALEERVAGTGAGAAGATAKKAAEEKTEAPARKANFDESEAKRAAEEATVASVRKANSDESEAKKAVEEATETSVRKANFDESEGSLPDESGDDPWPEGPPA